MSNFSAGETPISPELLPFSDFPEDVQLCILSFLTLSEISSFACTSKRNLSLCHTDSKLWFSMCDRRWGSKTHIKKWGSGKIAYKNLYKTLHEYENLIGFWRLSTRNQTQTQIRSTPNSMANKPHALVYFEWGSCFITGSRVSPSSNGNYDVIKSPFLLMGISPKGEIVNLLEPNYGFQLDSSLISIIENGLVSSLLGIELVNVDVNHIGEFHIVIEEKKNEFCRTAEEKRKREKLE